MRFPRKPQGFKRELLIYTLLYAVFFGLIFLPVLRRVGFILGGDGYNMYYPCTVNFRQTMLDFIDSVRAGKPRLALMNFNFGFGRDNYNMLAIFLACLPFFLPTVLMPVSWMPTWLTVFIFLFDYLAGIAFLRLCKHFGRQSDWNSLMAVGYAFCSNFLANSIFNPHFMYMLVCFPLMVIGIDRVLRREGWKLLAFCTALLGFVSFTFLVYTLPFLAVFALLRVWFTQGKHFWKNLLMSLLRCLPVLLCGMLLACIMMLPAFYLLQNSARSIGGSAIGLSTLLLPEPERMNTIFLAEQNIVNAVMFVIPGLLTVMLILPRHKELKAYLFAMCIIIALPLFDYGLNGFTYPLIRWGFVPALLFCYAASVGMDEMPKLSRRQIGLFLAALALYWVSYSAHLNIYFYAGNICSVVLLIWTVCAAIPTVRRLSVRALKAVLRAAKKLFRTATAKERSVRQYLALLGIIAMAALLIAGGVLAIFLPDYRFHPEYILICGMTAAALILLLAFRGKKWARCIMPVLACCYFGFTVFMHWNIRNSTFSTIDGHPTNQALMEETQISDHFNRSAVIMESAPDTGKKDEEEEQDLAGAYQPGNVNRNFDNQNLSIAGMKDANLRDLLIYNFDFTVEWNLNLIYNTPDIGTFDNFLDSDLAAFCERCGQSTDFTSITGISGFDRKESLHSLFGVDHIAAPYEADDLFGMRPTGVREYKDHADIHLFENTLALPVGVTYDTYMSAGQYDAMSSTMLPFACLQAAELESDPERSSGDSLPAGESYLCEYDMEKTFQKTNSVGMDIYDHTLKLKQDVTGCFLFVEITGANVRYPEFLTGKNLHLYADGKDHLFEVSNNESSWPWQHKTHRYSFEIGYCRENIRELKLAPPMEYDEIRLYAVPASVLEGAYAARCAETLQNVRFETNTLSGDITVSSEKLLSVALMHNDGWHVYVDGTEQPLEKVNRLFIGVMLPAGTHSVRFVYRSPRLIAGMICSLCGVVLWILLCFAYRRKKDVSA